MSHSSFYNHKGHLALRNNGKIVCSAASAAISFRVTVQGLVNIFGVNIKVKMLVSSSIGTIQANVNTRTSLLFSLIPQ